MLTMVSPPGSAGERTMFCPRCGTALPMEGRFCGNCGHVLEDPPLAAPAVPEARVTARAPAAAATSLPGPVAARPLMRTMMGTAFPAPGPAPILQPAPAPAPAPAGTARGSAPKVVPVFNAHQTMMGLVNPVVPSAPSAPGAAARPRGVSVASAQQTMMGIIAPAGSRAHGRAELPPMIGGIAPGLAPSSATDSGRGAAVPFQSADDDYDPLGRKRKSRAPGTSHTALWSTVGLSLTLAAGGATWLALRTRGTPAIPPVQAEVQSTETGLAMTVALQGQPPGTVVQYAGQRQALDALGRARFTLGDLGTRIGTIDLPIDVTPPNAATTRRTARLVLAYRVEPDLSGLGAEPPTARLIFQVLPAAHLRIDGQTVATDALGHGVATLAAIAPLAADGPAAHEQTLHIQVQNADGTVAEGSYSLRMPRTALALERPVGTTAITTAPRFVVRGHAPQATRVTVNRAPAVVQNGAFEAMVPLSTPGRVPVDIVAFSPGSAPAQMHVDIDRVAATDTAAFTRFLASNGAGINSLATNSLMTGQRVQFAGRVPGAPREHESGQTFQLVVIDRRCPAGHCLLWVDTEPGVAPAEGASADVIGTVTGRRTSVMADGERRSDPVVHAVVVR